MSIYTKLTYKLNIISLDYNGVFKEDIVKIFLKIICKNKYSYKHSQGLFFIKATLWGRLALPNIQQLKKFQCWHRYR